MSLHSSSCIAVLGCGSIGKRHIANLQLLGFDNVIAFDLQAERRYEVEEKFSIRTFEDRKTLWDQFPEAAFICTPNRFHISLSLEAAKRGCHLFIEKPLSDSMEGVDQLIRLLCEKQLVSLVGCNMRFHPGLRRVKQLLLENAVGRVVSMHVQVGQYLPDWHPKEDYRKSYSANKSMGGGIILDAIHEIDYARWLMGEVESVACFSGQLSHLEMDTEDTADVLVRFENQAAGTIHVDYIQRSASRTCKIIGDEGIIEWSGTEKEVRWYKASTQHWDSESLPTDWETNTMYVDELRHFARCLSGEEVPEQDVFDAKTALEIALAAKESSDKHSIIKLGHTN